MLSQQAQKPPFFSVDGFPWLLLIILAVVVPLITHYLLPAMGIFTVSEMLSPERISMLGFLLIGAVFYYLFFRFVTANPTYVVIFGAIFIRVLFFTQETFDALGKHIPLRGICVPVMLLPAIYLFFQNFPKLWKQFVFFRFFIVFLGLYIVYYLFHNLNFVDPTVALGTGVSISKGHLMDLLYGFSMMVLTGSAFIQAKDANKRTGLFEMLNYLLLLDYLIEACLAIFGYPVGFLTMKIEGFQRTAGFLPHPNEYGKSEGMALIYFIGLYYYYLKQEDASKRPLQLLLMVTICVNVLSFALSLSKNSFAGFGLALVIYTVSALFDPKLRKKLIVPLIIIGILIVGGLAGYQAMSGKDLTSLITDRFNDTRSLEWRTKAWNYLLSNVDMASVWLGHGLTACNMEMFRFQYDSSIESNKQSIYVHNAIIQFIYDMGLVGMTVFGSFLSTGYAGFRKLSQKPLNPLCLTLIALSAFAILGAITDECVTEMHLNMMFWFMSVMIFAKSFWKEDTDRVPSSSFPQSRALPAGENA